MLERTRNERSLDTPLLASERDVTESGAMVEGETEENQYLENVGHRNLSKNDCSHSRNPSDKLAYSERGAKRSVGSIIGRETAAANVGVVIGALSQVQKNYIQLQDAASKDKSVVSIFGVGT